MCLCTIAEKAFVLPNGTNKIFFGNLLCEKYFGCLRLFSVMKGNEAVGVALIFIDKNNQILGNYWWGVLPKYQGLGLETSLVYHIIEQAKACKLRFAVAQCLNTSRRLAESLGFSSFGQIYTYKSS